MVQHTDHELYNASLSKLVNSLKVEYGSIPTHSDSRIFLQIAIQKLWSCFSGNVFGFYGALDVVPWSYSSNCKFGKDKGK